MSGPGNSGLPGATGFSPFPKESPDPGTNTPLTNPGASNTPASVTSPTNSYNPYSPYTTPTFAYTPYSQYQGLSQQIAAAMNPTITPFAAPRFDLKDMQYAPWNPIFGGPVGGTMPGANIPGSTPPAGGTPPPTLPPTTRPPVTQPPAPPGTSTGPYTPPAGNGGMKDLPPDYYGYGGASVNYNNTRGLPPPISPEQALQQGGWRQAARNWLQQVPQAWLNRTGYVQGAHGATPMSFFGTNAYKGPQPDGGGPA